jgi:hypothetical protein
LRPGWAGCATARNPVLSQSEHLTSAAHVTKRAAQYAFENCGAKPGDMLTPKQTKKLVELATEHMMPFIQRHARRR